MAAPIIKRRTRRDGVTGRRGLPRVSVSPHLRVISLLFIPPILLVTTLAFLANFGESSRAQTRPKRSGAHSVKTREPFTAADRSLVERAIGAACAERVRDPLGSTPIDEMQARPSLPVNDPQALAGAQRAERLLPATRQLAAAVTIRLSRQYDLYGTA